MTDDRHKLPGIERAADPIDFHADPNWIQVQPEMNSDGRSVPAVAMYRRRAEPRPNISKVITDDTLSGYGSEENPLQVSRAFFEGWRVRIMELEKEVSHLRAEMRTVKQDIRQRNKTPKGSIASDNLARFGEDI